MIKAEDILTVVEGLGLSIDITKLKTNSPLVSQGFDSLDVATLMFELETKYGKALPPEKTAKLRTIEQIVDYLNA